VLEELAGARDDDDTLETGDAVPPASDLELAPAPAGQLFDT